MTSSPSSSEVSQSASPNQSAQKSLQQPAWHVVLLSVFTLGFYLFYWFYKTVRDLKQHIFFQDETQKSAGLTNFIRKTSPFILTLIMLAPTLFGPAVAIVLPHQTAKAVLPAVPIFTLACFAAVFRAIALTAPKESKAYQYPTFSGAMLAVCMASLFVLNKIPGPLYLLFTLVSVPAAIAQHWLNDYYRRTEPEDVVVRRAFSIAELIVMVVGSMILTLIMLTPKFPGV